MNLWCLIPKACSHRVAPQAQHLKKSTQSLPLDKNEPHTYTKSFFFFLLFFLFFPFFGLFQTSLFLIGSFSGVGGKIWSPWMTPKLAVCSRFNGFAPSRAEPSQQRADSTPLNYSFISTCVLPDQIYIYRPVLCHSHPSLSFGASHPVRKTDESSL